ncbi:MAG TPA: tetratricopeptide repeat protein, partial [Byssovorax sp.]
VERARVVEAKARPASAGPAVTAVSERGPALAVVKVAPVPDLEEDDPVARTVIRANGRAITVDEKQRSLGPDRDFDLAMTLFKDHKTERALEAFSTFLTRYPESPHAEAITFARAEAYAGKGDHRRAIEQFETVVSKWPGGAKAPDALLREAQSYAWLGDKSDSDETKKRLASAYPGSDAAKKLGAKTGAKP